MAEAVNDIFEKLQVDRDIAVGALLLLSHRGDITLGRSRELLDMGIWDQREELERLEKKEFGKVTSDISIVEFRQLKKEKERAIGGILLMAHYEIISETEAKEMLDWSMADLHKAYNKAGETILRVAQEEISPGS